MKLLETQDYLLFINKGAEIKRGDYLLEKESIINIFPDYLTDLEECAKILAHYPLTDEAKELDLPLLPNPFEGKDDIEQLSHRYYFDLEEKREKAKNFKGQVAGRHPDMLTSREMYAAMGGFVDGYKAAQQSDKQFSLENMIGFAKFYIIKHVIPYELDVISGKITDEQKVQMLKNDVDYDWNELVQEYVQSLSTQQLPKAFIPVYINTNSFGSETNGYDSGNFILKTITNSEGKQVLVGNYKY